ELEDVELVGRHLVDDLEQGRFAEEMPAFIDQQPAPPEARSIADFHVRNIACVAVSSDKLQKSLRAVEKSPGVGSFNQNFPAGRADVIAFRARDLGCRNQRKLDSNRAMTGLV